jgi:hypothetical protein
VIPSKYDGEEQNIDERGRGVHFEKQNAHKRGIRLFQTPTTQWRKEYHLLTLRNNQRRSLIFKWVQNLESTSSSMCYMHWLSCTCDCLHHAVKNPPLLILSLDLLSFLLNASLLCMWLSFLTRDLFHSSQQ